MGKKKTEAVSGLKHFISPIAKPLFDGKLLERSVKLVGLGTEAEAVAKKSTSKVRYIRRGVAEVTKALRKQERGIVLLASDVFPINILAHLPILCEEKNIVYGYVTDKMSLGKACKSARPTSVIMVTAPQKDDGKKDDGKFFELFQKVESAARVANPFFD
ncbi:ribosomal protein L7A [Gregarina niphandrodes]|uniref:Ribosomal protein L7A n=1 Tax=Gregarina niphandrodes TaxID=110365 RepID=A0A023B2J8_GRENI|nr:ribosomal protein L7A [Gregarina niphandrodes]EZG55045.1 ribosomal protein L7A [Gregarina niphandrodes]|eukprot:XP_011131812.1 ribosomal protein L7A [Gregarina niphandrodes]